jgi:hypothetical protein
MAAGISGSIKLAASIIDTLAAGVNRTNAEDIDLSPTKSTAYADGTTAGKVNRAHYTPLAFTASTPIIPNLSTIVCADGTVGMTYIRTILGFNDSTTDGQDITVGGGTTPFPLDLGGTTPTVLIRAGAFKVLFHKPLGATGLAVGSNVLLKLDPGSAAFAGRLLILGHT